MKTKVMTLASAVFIAVVLILALAMPVAAADIGGAITYTPSGSVVGTYVPDTTPVCTFTPSTAITAGSTITLTFPAGTALANIVAGDFTIAQVGGAATAPSAIDFDAVARTITLTVAAASLSGTGLGDVTIATSPGAGGDEIRHPTTVTTSGSFSVSTSVGDSGTINNVIFAHGAATKFVIIDPTDGTVDAAITVTVQLQDQYGNVVTTGVDKDKDVTLNADGSATGDGLVDIVNGVGTKDISDQVPETVNLTLADSQTTGFDVSSTQDVIFAHGAATKFVIIDPTDGTVDAAITVTVQLQDQYGNVVTTGVDKDKDVTLNADGSATGDGLVDIVNGVGTKDISDQVAETVNLTLTDSAGTGFDVTSNQDVIFAHGAATKFVIIDPTDGTVDAAITVTVQLHDQYGNVVTTGVDKDKDVTLNADGSATGDGLVDIANGVGTKDISDQVPETVNLTLTDSAGTGFDVSSTQDVIFALGAIDHYTVTSASYMHAVGAAFTVTVTAYDQYDNLVNTDSATQVTMTSSSGTMAFDGDGNGTFGEVGDDSKTLAAGTFDIQARDTAAGAGVTITATDPNTKTGTSAAYTIFALGGGGGGGAPPPPGPSPLELEVDLWGDTTSVETDEDGVLLEGVTATSPDGTVTITIAGGTQMLGPDGNPLAALTVETVVDPPDAGDGYHVIAAFDFGPDGTTCNPSIEITIEYDPSALPEGVDAANLVIAYYDEAAGGWVFVTGEVDAVANTVTFSAAHFTTFAILGAAPAAPEVTPPPAPSTSDEESGLSGGTWAAIGIGIVGLIGLSTGLIIRRRS